MKELILIIKEFVIMHKLLALSIALMCLILANVLLGSAIAEMKFEFKKEVFIAGVLKHVSIILGIVLIYIAGLCVPNLQLILVDERSLTLIELLDVGFVSALAVYAGKVAKNLFSLFSISANSVLEVNPNIFTGKPL